MKHSSTTRTMSTSIYGGQSRRTFKFGLACVFLTSHLCAIANAQLSLPVNVMSNSTSDSIANGHVFADANGQGHRDVQEHTFGSQALAGGVALAQYGTASVDIEMESLSTPTQVNSAGIWAAQLWSPFGSCVGVTRHDPTTGGPLFEDPFGESRMEGIFQVNPTSFPPYPATVVISGTVTIHAQNKQNAVARANAFNPAVFADVLSGGNFNAFTITATDVLKGTITIYIADSATTLTVPWSIDFPANTDFPMNTSVVVSGKQKTIHYGYQLADSEAHANLIITGTQFVPSGSLPPLESVTVLNGEIVGGGSGSGPGSGGSGSGNGSGSGSGSGSGGGYGGGSDDGYGGGY